MSGHLCLKWNNHSSAFLKSISHIHTKEKYCDSTIVCQGRYFPVHRVVLSTCSDYFDEMFERMQCQHPYIVFKDIEPREMELLLNYMYQGEVNVVQENLPTLIKAAEALKIKGLAVPDDLPSSKESSGRKRSNPSTDTPLSKRRAEERRKRSDSLQSPELGSYSQVSSDKNNLVSQLPLDITEHKIKEEPLDASEYTDNTPLPSLPNEGVRKEENIGLFVEFPVSEIKTEVGESQVEPNLYEGQSSSWDEYSNSNMDDLPPPDVGGQDDILANLSNLTDNGHQFQSYSSNQTSSRASVSCSAGKYFRCSCCPFIGTSKQSLERHMSVKHFTFRPFRCKLCPRAFKTKEVLKVHVRSHTGEKPFACSICNYRSTQSTHLVRHIKTHNKV